MNDRSMRSFPAPLGMIGRISLLAAAASFVAMTSGCAGHGGRPALTDNVRALGGVTANHGLDPGSRIAVGSGMAEDRGNVTIRCPADTPACEVVVAADGSLGYDPAGGVPAIVPLSPAPDSVEDLLRRRLYDSTWPAAVGFGGGVATCQALGCPVADAIHVDRPAAGGARHPSDDRRPDLSGFELLEPRRGIALAGKAQTAVEGRRSAFHRAFGAWMDHGCR